MTMAMHTKSQISQLLLASTILLACSASGTATAQTARQDFVVVTAKSLKQTEQDLDECIARHCSPPEDIKATLAHAENLFVAGKYFNARSVLLAGRARDRRFAKQYPIEVSDLLRANSAVAAHLGESEAFSLSSIDVVDALKSGLGADDRRVLLAQVEVADNFGKIGRATAAIDLYETVARRANKLDYADVEGLALFRLAAFYARYSDGGAYANELEPAIAKLEAKRDPRFTLFVKSAQLLRLRDKAAKGDEGAIQAYVEVLRDQPQGTSPVLIFAPPIPALYTSGRGALPARDVQGGSTGNNEYSSLPLRNYDDQWVDVSFFVSPSGHVDDAQIVRKSPKLESSDWVEPIIASINKRRYLPLKVDPGSLGALRVERYTLTSYYQNVLGTGIRQHSPLARIEVLDLSNDSPAPKTNTPS